MPYFSHQEPRDDEPREPVFRQPVEDDVGYDEDDDGELDFYDDDGQPVTDEEKRLIRQGRWRMLAGVGDFFGVVAGTIAILVLTALLVSLVTWVQRDITQSFTLWQTKL